MVKDWLRRTATDSSSFKEEAYKTKEWIVRNSGARFVWNILQKVIAIILILAFVGMIALGIIFVVNTYRTGVSGTIAEEGYMVLEETGVSWAIQLGVGKVWDTIFHPEKLFTEYSWESEIIENEENEDLGAKFTNIFSLQPRYFSGEPIDVIASVQAGTLKEEATITFDCELEDYYPTNEEEEMSIKPSKLIVHKGEALSEAIRCTFPAGIYAKKDIVTKKATAKLTYPFVTKARWKAYFMTKEKEVELIKRYGYGVNPFEIEKIQDQLISGREVKSQCNDGPINLGIGTKINQPFVEGDSAFIQFDINNVDQGYLKKVNSITLYVPPYVTLETDARRCDFYTTGETDEYGFPVYHLTTNTLTRINKECTKEALEGTGLSVSDCLSYFKDEIPLICDFTVTNLPDNVNMVSFSFRAEMDYIYEAEKTTLIRIIKTQDEIDRCVGTPIEECRGKEGCMVVGGVCNECPANWQTCEDYDSDSCLNDPCHFECKIDNGNCVSV